MKRVYLIGSLRNPRVAELGQHPAPRWLGSVRRLARSGT
jgi:hypothetical protein